ncbi:MAG TPA: 5'-methylthioadenosine nucleosidase [Xanthobacteraceae bacterium]|nr:5'-methylthioadenosine nucleosidase [Xanthobacteraceae bacterium]
MTAKILILTALESELAQSRAPDGVRVIYTGVGKVNTAIVTTQILSGEKPSLVVNYGTAGKIDTSLHGLVEISHVIQRDMMTMPLAPRGTTPLSDGPQIFSSGAGSVVCGTGDSFVTAADPWLGENNVGVVDMELFAIASVCHRYGVRWRSFKFITDDANESAPDHWTENVANGEDLFWNVLTREILQTT